MFYERSIPKNQASYPNILRSVRARLSWRDIWTCDFHTVASSGFGGVARRVSFVQEVRRGDG